MIAAETEIHALLKARAFAAAHFDVGDDVGAHGAHDVELEIDFARYASACPSFRDGGHMKPSDASKHSQRDHRFACRPPPANRATRDGLLQSSMESKPF